MCIWDRALDGLNISPKDGLGTGPYVLNDMEMDSLGELSYSDGQQCGHAVRRAEFIPLPSEGYPAVPLPGKDEATFDREEVDGERKLIVPVG